MGFSIVCYECGQVLYEGEKMILLYKLRNEINNRCPNCKRKPAMHPLCIKLGDKEFDNCCIENLLVHRFAVGIVVSKVLILTK